MACSILTNVCHPPAGGNAYNQLAVLATLADDKLSAVYFYFRSLAVAKPFGIARENLLLLFEANRVSFEGLPPRRGPDLDMLMKAMQQQPVNLLLQEFTVRLIHLHGEPLLRMLGGMQLPVCLRQHACLPVAGGASIWQQQIASCGGP